MAFSEFPWGNHHGVQHAHLVRGCLMLPDSALIDSQLYLVDDPAADDPAVLFQNKQVIPLQGCQRRIIVYAMNYTNLVMKE